MFLLINFILNYFYNLHKLPDTLAGDYSYYSGYYHGTAFDDYVMYLDAEDNRYKSDEIDKLVIGKFCSITTGVKFMMGGTQA
ncbi:acetyltransferase [Candidatus Rickettsia tasmanensis]